MPERLRVLHVFDHSVPVHSGYSYRSLAILRAQRAAGFDPDALTGPRQGSRSGGADEVAGVTFQRTPCGWLDRAPLAGQIDTVRRLGARLLVCARQSRPALLHAHSPALNAVAAVRVGHVLGIPVVYEVRAFWEDAAVDHGTARAGGLRYRLGRALESWCLRRAAAVVTISEGLRQELIQTRALAPERITVVPNGVDTAAAQPLGGGDPQLRAALGLEDCQVLGFVGSLYAYEGLELLFEALARLPERVQALVVGGGPQEAWLRSRAAALGVEARVLFMGQVPHEEVALYYALADLLVYPRRPLRLTELVTPLKPLEAMALGRTVVASDVGGHRELIADGQTGALFRAGDPAALAARIAGLLAAPAEADRLRRAARQFVERERHWDDLVGRYADVYGRALQQKGRPA